MTRKKTSAQLDREIASVLGDMDREVAPVKKSKPKRTPSEKRRIEAMRAVRRDVKIFLSGGGRLTPDAAQDLVEASLRAFPGLAAQGSDDSIEVWDTKGDYFGPEFALWITDEFDRGVKHGEVR